MKKLDLIRGASHVEQRFYYRHYEVLAKDGIKCTCRQAEAEVQLTLAVSRGLMYSKFIRRTGHTGSLA
jgi:hypothetical protein